MTSPDGNFSISINTIELSDSQSQYIVHLTDNLSKTSIEIANSIVKDLPPLNYYWDKSSRYLIFEQSNSSFEKAKIKIINLKTKKIDVELVGLIGNNDREKQQYDSDNEIIFYFHSSNEGKGKMPQLRSYELIGGVTKVLINFDSKFEMDFPAIKRSKDKRELVITCFDSISGNHVRRILY